MAFGSFQSSRHTQPVAEINTTPLVDVMLVLLVIFMLTLPLITQRLALDLPETDSDALPSAAHLPHIALGIDERGQLFWDGIAVSAAELEVRLRTAAQQQPKPELHLHADQRTTYQRLAEVIAAAQRNGMNQVGFITAPRARE